MKRLTLIGLLAVLFAGCKKDKDNLPEDSFLGRWQLKKINAHFPQTFSSLDGYYVEFSETAYKSRLPNAGVKTGTWSVEPTPPTGHDLCEGIPGNPYPLMLVYDRNSGNERICYMDTTYHQLRLGAGCFAFDSGVEYVFERSGGSN